MAQLIQLLPLLVLLLLSPARGGASGDAAAACEAGGVGELAARLARLEQLVAEIHAAVVYAPASTPAAAPLPAPASQWVTADNQISESTIHFMFGLWDDGAAMPRHFQESMDVWARLNPSNTLKLWSGAEVKKLWAEHFPQYKYLWRKIMPIQRADIGRLMITLVHGGFYADLDTRPGQPVDAMLDNAGLRRVVHDAAVCVEDHKTPEAMAHTAKWPIRKGVPEFHIRIANYFFWAAAGSSFVKRALDLAIERVSRLKPEDYLVRGQPGINNPYSIIYSTGPDVLTEAAFPVKEDGTRVMKTASLLVVPKGKCLVTNKATGTWIGDDHPAWRRDK